MNDILNPTDAPNPGTARLAVVYQPIDRLKINAPTNSGAAAASAVFMRIDTIPCGSNVKRVRLKVPTSAITRPQSAQIGSTK